MTIVVTCTVCPPSPPPLPMALPPCSGCGDAYNPYEMEMFCPTVPDMAQIGTADTTVSVQGRNFTATCVVYVDGVAQPTTFISPTALEFTVKPSQETTAHTSTVSVIETVP